MDNRAGEMEVFATAAELQSFSAAGRKLKMSPSAVSKLVSRIEDRLGARLIVRSTRAMTLTTEGELYLARARRILADIDETEQVIAGCSGTAPRGLLRVNATLGFGERFLLPLAPKFLTIYPEVQLDITLTDGVIGLIEERADIAIRSGSMSDSTLKAKKLFESRRLLVASPAYLEKYGIPETPDDLSGHNCLCFNFRSDLNQWPFRRPGSTEVYRVAVSGNMSVNSGMIVRRLCVAGNGIGRVGQFHVQPDLDAGLLVPVLDRYNPEDIERVHAVFVAHEHLAARIRAFIDFMVEHLKREAADVAPILG